MAQWIATRPDLFDLEAVHELSVLQAHAYSHNERALVNVLSETFKHCNGVLDVTLDIDSMLGSGSVASVYRGKLRRRSANGHEDGGAEEMEEEDVAVKMIHPEVRDSINADLRVMRSCVSFFTGILPFDPVSLADSVEQFASLMQDQLDMRTEARNLDRFNELFKDHQHIFFPVPVPGWVSENVLVESFEEGPPVSDFLSFPPAQPHPKVGTDADRLQLAQLGLEAVMRMVFEHNFVHADLHPGNVIVRGQKDGGSSKDLSFVMIDAGITASLHSSDRRNFIELFRAVVLNDGRHAGHLIMKRSMLGLEGCLDPEGFEKKLAVVIDECHKKGLSLGRLGVAELLTRVLTLCYKHRVRLDPTFTQLVLGIVVVDGLGRRLDADIDILQACGPHVLRAAANIARGSE
jgi:aarF domain-containing kinase